MLSKAKYEVLPQDEYSRIPSPRNICFNKLAQLPWRFLVVLILIPVSFMAGTRYETWNSTDSFGFELAWSSELSAMPLSWRKLDGNFDFLGKYKGEPSLAIDRAWDRYSANPWIDGAGAVFPVTEDDIRKSRKATDEAWFNSSVKFDEKDGGGYMGTLEMFHQLHCLNMIRMSTRPEHYSHALHWNTTSDILVKHIDHCIDMIRQVIMCSGDTTLLTFHWVKDNPFPYPDFNTWHQCRDPEAILDWALERQPPFTSLPVKNHDTIEMPVAP